MRIDAVRKQAADALADELRLEDGLEEARAVEAVPIQHRDNRHRHADTAQLMQHLAERLWLYWLSPLALNVTGDRHNIQFLGNQRPPS